MEVVFFERSLRFGVEAKGFTGFAESKGDTTSFATFKMDLIPRSISPFQSRALSSEPSHIPGMI